MIVTAGHFTNDLYVSFLGPLIPAIQTKLGISLFIASLMVPAHQFPSLFQPFIGAWADRKSKRWFVILAPAVAAIGTSSVGLAPNVAIVLLLLMTSGLASAAFHAPAVALIGEYGGSKTGQAMSIFMAGGEAARTLGPLLITAAIAIFTLEGSWVVVFFGLAAALILYLTVDTKASDEATADREHINVRPILRVRWKMVAGLFGFVTIANFFVAPFSFFLFTYLIDQNESSWYAGLSLAVFFASGGIGGLIGGSLSDSHGRRAVFLISVLCSLPIVYLYLAVEQGGLLGLIILAVAGMIGLSNRPVGLALAQDILPEARGQMAGLMLATGFVTTSLIALSFGALADSIGIQEAFWLMPVFSLLAVPCIWLLPRRGQRLPQPEARSD